MIKIVGSDILILVKSGCFLYKKLSRFHSLGYKSFNVGFFFFGCFHLMTRGAGLVG